MDQTYPLGSARRLATTKISRPRPLLRRPLPRYSSPISGCLLDSRHLLEFVGIRGRLGGIEAVMAAGEEQGGCGSRWTASTNWILAGGSLQNAISFETSEEDAPSPEISDPLLLVRPPAVAEEDFLPCEVTILFSGQYEIRRIYVQSTARVYEIYYAADERSNSMEYLCTVRCDVAAKEMTPPISSMVSVESESVSHTILEKQDKMSVAYSNSSSEDGWVEVVTDSALHDVKTNSISRQVDENSDAGFQTYYEATADISDFNPCMAVTLRFLSLQTKTRVHISEIYVYADPVETSSPGTPVTTEENFGGTSLLTMFIPTLLQLSKSATSRQNHFSDAFGVHRNQDGRQDVAEVASSGITLPLETNSSKADLLLGVHESSQFKPEFFSSASNMEVTDKESDSSFGNKKMDLVHEKSDLKPEITEDIASSSKILPETKKIHENMHFSDSKIQINPDQISISAKERVIVGNRIEMVLDELVSRVTRIEEVCSRFEEHLVKPLSSIEGRLHKLETMLAKFTQGKQFHRPGGSSRIFLPEYFSDGSDLENEDTNESSCTSRDGIICHDSSLAADVLQNPSPIVDVREIATESKISPGFEIKAPEFAIEDDECLQCDSSLATDVNFGEAKKLSPIDNDDDECGKDDVVNELGRDDASLPCNVSSGEVKKFLSIDHALASSLEAFMCSELKPTVREHHNLSASDKSTSSSSSPARDLPIAAGNSDRSLNELEDEITAPDSLSFPAASKMIVNDSGKDSDHSTFSILEVSDAFHDLFIPCDTLMSSSPFLDDGLELMAPDWGNFVASKEYQESLLNARDDVRANHDGPSSSQFDANSVQAVNGTTHLAANSTASEVSIIFNTKDSNQAQETPELPSSFDPVMEMNFITEKDWTSGIPLEILLGVALDSKAEDSTVADTTEEGIVADQLLDGIENLSFPADSSYSYNDGIAESNPDVDLDDFGKKNFSSLI
ncbi:hypothetical protein ZIOFF_042868 [Zingiber officinale]|uniref:Uncharacterized protein n=2 Tax=Zingiber officinale TaxID=94328 RepID=A0A8J5G9V7_ZINOF|nr:hypothetical protein ZIOFF_042868 [Zingiber officinale]